MNKMKYTLLTPHILISKEGRHLQADTLYADEFLTFGGLKG